MTKDHAQEFTRFFNEMYEFDPFPWQKDLLQQVTSPADADRGWPHVLALPTASGKTACIDIAVFALAWQADWPSEKRTAPRRIFFVVDRRVIVDEAFERALNLAEKLKTATNGVTKDIADRLRHFAGEEESPLACFQLRGGIYRDDAWARTPVQPTVIASTVDQIGSRLLFRGYGLRSGYMWPLHAGLVANDSLIILDEAHCANPFRQTIEAIRRYRTWAEEDCVRNPFQVVIMSATPGTKTDEGEAFRLSSEDYEHEILGPRIKAVKPTRLIEAKKAKGDNAIEELAEKLVDEAIGLAKDKVRAVAIFVNRVAAARKVHEKLTQMKKGDTVLLTGRMRPIDRDATVQTWLETLRATQDGERNLERPVFVTATQCLEVGANLDFDGMVSECASLDALRQRFGRLNRPGKTKEAPGVIVIRTNQKTEKDDPVYGAALAETWKWLKNHAESNIVDMGISAIDKLIKQSQEDGPQVLSQLYVQAPDAPVMLPAHVDCWVQTSPVPTPDPDVSLFLHGPQRGAPEIQVLWRCDLGDDETKWIETVALCPPSSVECMPVPLHVFRKWLQENKQADVDLTDVETSRASEQSRDRGLLRHRTVLRWCGPEDSELIADSSAIRPGDTVVLPVDCGGWEVFGHIPTRDGIEPIIDVADEAHLQARAKAVLRLNENVMESWPFWPAKNALADFVNAEDIPEDDSSLREPLLDLSNEDVPRWLSIAAGSIARDKHVRIHQHPSGGLVLQGSRRIPELATKQQNISFTDEDLTSSATVRVTLSEHSEGVCQKARGFAERSGLPSNIVEDIALAGRLHDIGKADPRFQTLLYRGNSVLAKTGDLLAKSDRMIRPTRRSVLGEKQSEYPKGGRHELLSVRLSENVSGIMKEAHDPELLLYLIASHHGRCRPFAPVIDDPSPVQVTLEHEGYVLTACSVTELERVDSGVPERFWKLVRRYGWWGLAWLEAILRLADHRQSEREEREKEK